ncbi:MAG: hypothetical protein LBC61_04785 [Candidatus Peribacteria bacterium]|jgi:hypothetical protein|nr:hypothetical protein [Candidatus Peribacteria bacterium]
MALIFRKFLKPKELKDMKPEEIAKLDLANTNPKRINDLLRESGLEELTPEQLKIVKDLHNDVSK